MNGSSASPRTFFITGTDTGVGKTVVASLLARHLQGAGHRVSVFKPISSGSRADARLLRASLVGAPKLEEVNPWHFRAALAPLVAARQQGHRLRLAAVVRHIGQRRVRGGYTLVEGAGGLLSPLGEGFDNRDLLDRLRAVAIVVAPNRLGAVNQVRLTLEALPVSARRQARVALVQPPRPALAGTHNPRLLRELTCAHRICLLPWLRSPFQGHGPIAPDLGRALSALVSP